MRWRNSFPAALMVAASAVALWPAIAQRIFGDRLFDMLWCLGRIDERQADNHGSDDDDDH